MYGDVYAPDHMDEPEMEPCLDCKDGKTNVWRNFKGEIDYMDGKPTDELIDCEKCEGTGEVEVGDRRFDDDAL